MLNLADVLNCKRVLNYHGMDIEYTTGLGNEVYLNPQHCLNIIQSMYSKNFGYVQDMEDFVYLLKKFNCLNKCVASYDNVIVANYLYYNNISLESMLKLTGKAKCEQFNKFLKEARDIICKYGIYLPDPTMKRVDKRKNNDRNLAESMDLSALTEGAYKLGMFEDQLYLDIANIISDIVFGVDIETVRMNYGLYYEDYLSDSITDYEYDMVYYCCKVASYLLKYSDISLYGINIFIRDALNEAMKGYTEPVNKSVINTTASESQVIANIFESTTGSPDLEPVNDTMYSRRLKKKSYLSKDEINEFKKYL